jgi:hypothetical protein
MMKDGKKDKRLNVAHKMLYRITKVYAWNSSLEYQPNKCWVDTTGGAATGRCSNEWSRFCRWSGRRAKQIRRPPKSPPRTITGSLMHTPDPDDRTFSFHFVNHTPAYK